MIRFGAFWNMTPTDSKFYDLHNETNFFFQEKVIGGGAKFHPKSGGNITLSTKVSVLRCTITFIKRVECRCI